jgi:hypothetical protein
MKDVQAFFDKYTTETDLAFLQRTMQTYLRAPVPPAVIECYRKRTLERMRVLLDVEPTTPPCIISPNMVMVMLYSFDEYFFDHRLFKVIPVPKLVYHPKEEGPIAYYRESDHSFGQLCASIQTVREALPLMRDVPLRDKNLRYDDFWVAALELFEHELVHMLVWRLLKEESKGQIAHGKVFRKVVRNMFGHGWGDLALVALGGYLREGPEVTRQKMLAAGTNFDEEYITTVDKLLQEVLYHRKLSRTFRHTP